MPLNFAGTEYAYQKRADLICRLDVANDVHGTFFGSPGERIPRTGLCVVWRTCMHYEGGIGRAPCAEILLRGKHERGAWHVLTCFKYISLSLTGSYLSIYLSMLLNDTLATGKAYRMMPWQEFFSDQSIQVG